MLGVGDTTRERATPRGQTRRTLQRIEPLGEGVALRGTNTEGRSGSWGLVGVGYQKMSRLLWLVAINYCPPPNSKSESLRRDLMV